MVGVRLSAQTIHGMRYGYEIGNIEGSFLGTKLVSLEGFTYGTIYIDGIIEGSYLGA